MAWQNFYQASFIRPIRENVQALLEANEAESLAWANDGDPLDPYKLYRKALWYNTLWPVMSVVSQTTEFIGGVDEARAQEHSILVEIELAGPDPDALAVEVERRIAAADMIIMSAAHNLFRAGMDENAIAIKDVSVAAHEYTQFTRGTNLYLQAGSLIARIQTIELPV